MLRDTAHEVEIEIGTVASLGAGQRLGPESDWRIVDRALRAIRQRRATLDAEEARWLREAEQLQIWRPLGMVSALDYMERVLGYAPRTAQERLRVARALGDLPQLQCLQLTNYHSRRCASGRAWRCRGGDVATAALDRR